MHAQSMPKSLVSRLETDAKLIRVLLLVRTSLWDTHGAAAKLRDGTLTKLDSTLEVAAIDASLKALGVEPPPTLLPSSEP